MLSGYHLNETSASIEAELSKSTEQLQCIFNVLGVPSLYIILYYILIEKI